MNSVLGPWVKLPYCGFVGHKLATVKGPLPSFLSNRTTFIQYKESKNRTLCKIWERNFSREVGAVKKKNIVTWTIRFLREHKEWRQINGHLGEQLDTTSEEKYTKRVGEKRTQIHENCLLKGEPGSSVSIVSGYGLDDQAFEVRSLAEAKGHFL
jgi:hypothetical protein